MSDVRCQMSDVAHWTGVYNIDEDDYCLPLVLLNVRCQMSDVAHWTGVYNIDEDDYCLSQIL